MPGIGNGMRTTEAKKDVNQYERFKSNPFPKWDETYQWRALVC